MVSVDLPYTQAIKKPNGRVFWYYRRNGRRRPLKGEPGSPEFMKLYWTYRGEDDGKLAAKAAPARTFKRLAVEYYASPKFRALKESTQRAYRSMIGQFLEEFESSRVADWRFRHVNKMIGDMADRPGAANNRLKRVREMFGLAVQMEWIDRDPSKGVAFYKLGEIHTWTDDEIAQYLNHWPAGTWQRLWFMLQLYTGQRNSDIVKEPWPRDGEIRVTQEKTGKHMWIPVDPALSEELALHPRRHALIIATSSGQQRSAGGYGNKLRDAISKAELPARCKPHGLRKAAAMHLAEAGCTAHEIMAITGHETLAEVERYTRAANQQGLAKSAAQKRSANIRVATTGQNSGNRRKD